MEKVSKNWLLHGTKVKADIASEETDWSSANYFKAGKDTAAAVDLLVPFKSTQDLKIEWEYAIQFLGGFLKGFVEDAHLTEI